MACRPTSSPETPQVTAGDRGGSRDDHGAQLPHRSGYDIGELVLVGLLTAFSSLTRWALVHTARPRRTRVTARRVR